MTEYTMTQNIQIIHVSHTDTSTSQSRDHVIMSELEIAISHGTHIHVALLSTPQPIIPRRSLSREKKQKKKKNDLHPTPSSATTTRRQISLLSAFELSLTSLFSFVIFRFSSSFVFFLLVWFGLVWLVAASSR